MKVPIDSIMTRNVISVTEEMSIFDAIHLLGKNKISGLPVVDEENNLKGVLTEKDVLSILYHGKFKSSETVGDYMSRNVYSFPEDADAIEVCKCFLDKSIRRVPIVRDGKLVGVVSRRDLVGLIIEARDKIAGEHYT